MYSRYSKAMRTNFSASRPAQPVFFVDATSGALGRGLTHGEIGSAPVAEYEGSDKGVPLREHLDLVLPTFNRLVERGTLSVDGKSIPARPITSADMQGTKALFGKCSTSHATWCKCQPGVDQQHKYATEPVDTYEEMRQYIDDEVGCVMLTFDAMCINGH
jgi:hypothetical protein